ncbi:MAG: hypothetical protein KBB95_27195, partial [Deltaproteobacteria bacterium]|nr:hypothetical protein [Deltaproteobacteria bacterium]
MQDADDARDDDSEGLPQAAGGGEVSKDARDAARWEACEEGIETLREGDAAGAIKVLEAVAAADP